MSNAMRAAYRGDPFSRMTHTLGFPISNEFRGLTPDARDRYQLFERGTIFLRAAESRYFVEQGAVREGVGYVGAERRTTDHLRKEVHQFRVWPGTSRHLR
jgi:hypothetical protein